MGRTKSPDLKIQLLALCLLKQKLKADKVNIAKISVNKLASIGDPHTKLRKAVLINNVIKKVGKEETIENTASETILKFSPGSFLKPNIPEKTEASSGELDYEDDHLSFCDDIIRDFLGTNKDEMNKSLNRINTKENAETSSGAHFVPPCTSPYSYSSFLSEINKVQNIY